MSLRVLGLLLAFVAQAVLSNILGLEGFSDYSVFLSYALLLAVVVKFGMDISVLKFGAEYFASGKSGILNYFAGQIAKRLLLNTAAMAVLIVGVSWYWPGFVGLPTKFSALWMILFIGSIAALGVFSQFFRAAHMIGWAQTLDQVSRSACLLLALTPFWFWGVELSLETAIIVVACSSAAAVVILAVMFRKMIWRAVTGIAENSERSKWFAVSLPIFGASIVGQMYAQMQILMLDRIGDPNDPGLYAVAIRLVTMTTFVLTALNSVTAPMMAEAFGNKDMVQLRRIVSMTARIATAAGAAIVLVIVLAGPHILLIFGDGFDQAYPALLILCCGALFGAMTGPVGYFMTMTDQQGGFLSTAIVNLVVVAVISYVAISHFGLLGAAFAAASGQIFLNAIRWWRVWSKAGIDTSFIGLRGVPRD